MMLIKCPHCGARSQEEFRWGGEAHVSRPSQPATVSDEAWTRYLFVRKNSHSVEFERWQHLYGCGRWFNIARNNTTHEVLCVYGIDEMPPEGQPA